MNVCVIKIVSNGAICGSSALGCCGDDSSRLANCNSSQVNAAFSALPASFSLDWRAVVLNGSSWWNTGSSTMLWSGGGNDAPGAALHEGGHGFHQLSDEYGTCTGANCGANTMGASSAGTGPANAEVNTCGNAATTDGKWDMWIGYNQVGATGLQGTWNGSRYVANQYRPSANSMMNSLFGNNVNTSFNAPSREQMVMSIWRVVRPIDSTEPTAGAVNNPAMLKVNVVDPGVINVDWAVDGGRRWSTVGRRSILHPRGREPHDHGDRLRQRRDGSGTLPIVNMSFFGDGQLLPSNLVEEFDPDRHLDGHEVI